MNLINEIFSTTFSDALGWTLFHSLWQGLIIAILLYLALALFNNKSAKFKYALSVFAMASMLTLLIATFFIRYSQTEAMPQSTTSVIEFTPGNLTSDVNLPGENMSTMDQFFNTIPDYWSLIISIWIVGVILGIIRIAGGFVLLKRKIDQTAASCESLRQKVTLLSQQLGINKMVRIKTASFIDVPAVFGHIKPIILLPIGLINHLDTEQVEMILLHELAHIKRNDFLVNILQSIVEIILFFNPAMWWVSSEIKKERENCCDDLILNFGHAPIQYVKTLANVNEFRISTWKLMPGILGNGDNQLLNRMQRLIPDYKQKHFQIHGYKAFSVFFILTLLITFASWQSISRANQKELSNADTLLKKSMFNPFTFDTDYNSFPLLVQTDTIKNKKAKEKAVIKAQEDEIKALKAELERLKAVSQSENRERQAVRAEKAQHEANIQREIAALKRLAEGKQIELTREQKEILERQLEKIEISQEMIERELSKSMTALSKEQIKEIEGKLEEMNIVFEDQWVDFERMHEELADIADMDFDFDFEPLLDLNIELSQEMLALHEMNFDSLSFNFKHQFQEEFQEMKQELAKFQEKMNAFKAHMLKELKSDGIIDTSTETIKIKEADGKLIINGKTLSTDQSIKYRKIINEYLGHFDSDDQYQFEFDVKDNKKKKRD